MPWKKYNLFLVIFPILISSLGFITLFSVSPERAKDQFLFLIVGIVLFIPISLIGHHIFMRVWKYIYFGNIFFLFLTYALGKTILGSTRWLTVAGITLQPSEFMKLTLIISLSCLIAERPDRIKTFRGVITLFKYFLPAFIAVLIQPDLGTSVVLMIIFVGILLFAGLNYQPFLVSLGLLGIFSSPVWNLLKDYQKNRILVFLNPQLDKLGAGYNVVQSLIAVGSGGLMGKGFGRGSQSHLEFLPAYWTDFILASFAEEWGFIGLTVFILLFSAFLISLLFVVHKACDSLGSILTFGIFLAIFSQFFIGTGINLGIMPVTGIPLPFMTYGGSSLITTILMLGLAQGVWVQKTNVQ